MFEAELEKMVQVTITREDLEAYRTERQEVIKKIEEGIYAKEFSLGYICAFQRAAKRAFKDENKVNVSLSTVYAEGSEIVGTVNQSEQFFWDKIIGQCDLYASGEAPKNREVIYDLLPATVNIVLTNQD